jgi:hypothetical protein
MQSRDIPHTLPPPIFYERAPVVPFKHKIQNCQLKQSFWSACIVFLPLIEILTKIINHTHKETYLKAPHPVIYGGVLITSTRGGRKDWRWHFLCFPC